MLKFKIPFPKKTTNKRDLYRIIIMCTMYIAHILFIVQNISEIGFNVLCSTNNEVEIELNPNGPLFHNALYIAYKNQFIYNKVIWAKEVEKYLCRLEKGELEKPDELDGIEKLDEIEKLDGFNILERLDKLDGIEKLDEIANVMGGPRLYIKDVIVERNKIMMNILKNKIQEADICKDQDRRKYLIEYSHQLLLLFPSKYGIFSTVSEKEDSLSNYLLGQLDPTYSNRTVAALFILSQGVDLPIEVKKEKDGSRTINLVLNEKEERKVYIKQKISIGKENARNPEYSTEIEQLINFLRDCMKNPIFSSDNPKGIKEPTAYEEFMTGDFLNTPQFLIQSYIYEILDDNIVYNDIMVEIVNILISNIYFESDPDLVEKSKQLYNKCFLQLDNEDQIKIYNNTVKKYLADIKKLDSNESKHPWIPFKHRYSNLTHTRVQKPNLDTAESQIEAEEDAKYSNTVEFALLALFCCMMYDPVDNKYTTEHLSETFCLDVKEFFKRHDDPDQKITQKMQQEWSNILSNLKDSSIRYNKDKYELKSGLINILHVIKCIVGDEKMVNKAIMHVKGESKLRSSGRPDPRSKIDKLLIKLSKSTDLHIDEYSFKMEKVSENESDFFGRISLIYASDKRRNGLIFTISQTHMAIDIYPEEVFDLDSQEIYDQESNLILYTGFASFITKKYENPTSFIEYVILQRAKIHEEIIGARQYAIQYVHSDYVKEWIREDKNLPIDFIFLQGRIADMMD
ncbi:hypothetical protein NEPAR07_0909 [Nematocida parisii]|nr:hypothetical protein NEPAR07_0909 [Nematocida parisii]